MYYKYSTISVRTQQKSYPVHIGRGLLSNFSELVPSFKSVMLVTDSNVDKLYSEKVVSTMSDAKMRVKKFVFPAGEKSKNLTVYSSLLEALATSRLTRSDAVFALGGGVTGDLAGFAAATYLRGVSFVQLPTSALAMVDSSVGGKTGVNLEFGKNLVGAFWQPDAVVCDTTTLASLPQERLADGVAEMLKHGMIADAKLFDSLYNVKNLDDIAMLIPRNVEIKAAVVGEDEREKGKRALLNFGHTLAHAIEKRSSYSITHGHAVALGMLAITRAAEQKGLCENISPLLQAALKKHNLPDRCPYLIEELLPFMLSDKKRCAENIKLVIPKRIGECVLYKIPIDKLPAFFEDCL